MTETFLGEDILDSEIMDNIYQIFRIDRNRQGGGVMLLTKNTISAIRRHEFDSNCELLWVELMLSAKKILIGVFYCPPSSSSDYLSQLEHSLACIPVSCPVILCGDFNVPHINWANISSMTSSGVANKLCELVLDHSLQQLVLEPTRHRNVLDLLLTNCPDRTQMVEVVDNLSGGEHDAVYTNSG